MLSVNSHSFHDIVATTTKNKNIKVDLGAEDCVEVSPRPQKITSGIGFISWINNDIDEFPPLASQHLYSYSLQAWATSRDKLNQLCCIALILFVLAFRHVGHYYCCGVHGHHMRPPDGILFVSLFIVSLVKRSWCELPAESDASPWPPKGPETGQLWREVSQSSWTPGSRLRSPPLVPFVMSQRLCFQAATFGKWSKQSK